MYKKCRWIQNLCVQMSCDISSIQTFFLSFLPFSFFKNPWQSISFLKRAKGLEANPFFPSDKLCASRKNNSNPLPESNRLCINCKEHKKKLSRASLSWLLLSQCPYGGLLLLALKWLVALCLVCWFAPRVYPACSACLLPSQAHVPNPLAPFFLHS